MSDLFGNKHERRWYVVQTYSGYEKKVKANLDQRIATMRMEDKIGSIEVDKYADMVILDRNVFEIPIEEVYQTKICETIMNGETTYKA